jgi:hypothetical protein
MVKKNKNLKNFDEAKDILKKIIKESHIEAQHKSTGSRLKSIFGLQKTSIGMFLDSLLARYKNSVSKNNYNSEVEELVDLMHRRQDIWDSYQEGGDYPATFGYVMILMMESISGKKADKKNKDSAGKEMLEEIEKI